MLLRSPLYNGKRKATVWRLSVCPVCLRSYAASVRFFPCARGPTHSWTDLQPELLLGGSSMNELNSTGVDVGNTEPRHPGAHAQRVRQLEVAIVIARLNTHTHA